MGVIMEAFEYEIVKEIGVVTTDEISGLQVEVNLIIWNNGNPCFDIREWSKDRKKIGKGFSFDRDEYEKLKKYVRKIDEIEEKISNVSEIVQKDYISKSYQIKKIQVKAIARMAAEENRIKEEIVRAALEQYLPKKYFG